MADDKDLVNQNEIERLLQQGGAAKEKPAEKPGQASAEKASGETTASPGGASEPLDQADIEALLGGGKPDTPKAPPSESPDDSKLLAQQDIEKLLSQAGKTPPARKPAPAKEAAAGEPQRTGEGDMAAEDIDYLLAQAERALESIQESEPEETPPGVTFYRLEEFPGAPASTEAATLDLIRDVDLDLKIELGRTHMYLEDVLKLRKGSVVPLDKLAGDPVDIFVNGRLIARGEVLVLNDNFCVRVAELIAGDQPQP